MPALTVRCPDRLPRISGKAKSLALIGFLLALCREKIAVPGRLVGTIHRLVELDQVRDHMRRWACLGLSALASV